MHIFHDWYPWVTLIPERVPQKPDAECTFATSEVLNKEGATIGYYVIQKRVCKTCAKVQLRMART